MYQVKSNQSNSLTNYLHATTKLVAEVLTANNAYPMLTLIKDSSRSGFTIGEYITRSRQFHMFG